MRAMVSRTDGPALNGVLAATGALLAVFSLLVTAGLLISQLKPGSASARGARCASVEVIPYALPFREPYVTARGTLDRREMVLLRLRAEEGLVGLGEAVPLSLRGGATLEQVVEELERLGRAVLWRRARRGGAAEGKPRGSTPPSPLSAPARCAALTALRICGERRDEARDADADPGPPATRRWSRRAPRPSPRTRCGGRRTATRPSS